MPNRKLIRMNRESYKGMNWFFATMCCRRAQPIFSSPAIAMWLERLLREHAAKGGFLLHAWCIMPNHVHFLVKGTQDSSDLIAFVTALKQRTAYEARREFGVQLWQLSFYDHLVRQEESVPRIAAYIWANPVRSQFCADASEYPFSGSMTVKWKTKIAVSENWTPPWKAERA